MEDRRPPGALRDLLARQPPFALKFMDDGGVRDQGAFTPDEPVRRVLDDDLPHAGAVVARSVRLDDLAVRRRTGIAPLLAERAPYAEPSDDAAI